MLGPGRAPAAARLAAALLSAAACAPAAPVFHASPATRALDLPFSDAVEAGDIVFVSGQIGNAPGSLALVDGGIRAQAAQALANVRAILAQSGSGMDRVVKCTVFLADMGDWPAFNEVYREAFPDAAARPARSALGASGLAVGALVELECIALRGR
ncbi:MAG: RidA family protein [Myxococcales bacterium]|nr:RidA family protein [Myxococcales bacterium]